MKIRPDKNTTSFVNLDIDSLSYIGGMIQADGFSGGEGAKMDKLGQGRGVKNPNIALWIPLLSFMDTPIHCE